MMREAIEVAGLISLRHLVAALEFWKDILLNKMGGKSDE